MTQTMTGLDGRSVISDTPRPGEITADRERIAEHQLALRRMPIGRDGRHDQAGEHQVHADELHGGRHDDGKQHIEANAPDALAPA